MMAWVTVGNHTEQYLVTYTWRTGGFDCRFAIPYRSDLDRELRKVARRHPPFTEYTLLLTHGGEAIVGPVQIGLYVSEVPYHGDWILNQRVDLHAD